MRKDVINTPGVRWANKYVLKKEVEEDGGNSKIRVPYSTATTWTITSAKSLSLSG